MRIQVSVLCLFKSMLQYDTILRQMLIYNIKWRTTILPILKYVNWLPCYDSYLSWAFIQTRCSKFSQFCILLTFFVTEITTQADDPNSLPLFLPVFQCYLHLLECALDGEHFSSYVKPYFLWSPSSGLTRELIDKQEWDISSSISQVDLLILNYNLFFFFSLSMCCAFISHSLNLSQSMK